METRRLTEEDLDQYCDLLSFAFQFELTDELRQRASREIGTVLGLGVFDGVRLASGMQVIPFETYIWGNVFKMGGVAGIATWPEYRRQRLVERLLQESLGRMRHAGQVVSYLFPFKYEFYRRYGWEASAEGVNYTMGTDNLPTRFAEDGEVRRWDEDLSVINRVYQDYASGYNGSIVRDSRWWRMTVLKPGRRVYVYHSREGGVEGYIIFSVKDGDFRVHEWVNQSIESTKALWNFIGNHDSMVNKILWSGPYDHTAWTLARNPPSVDRQIVARHMARIVDIEQFFGNYPFACREVNGPLALNVVDTHARWNHGSWLVVTDEGEVRFRRLEGDGPRPPSVECSIQALTALALGSRSVEQLVFQGDIQGERSGITGLGQLFRSAMVVSTDHY